MDKFFNFLVSIAVLSCPVRARSYKDYSYESPDRHLGFQHRHNLHEEHILQHDYHRQMPNLEDCDQKPITNSSPATTSTMKPTTQALGILLCISSCPVTSEYNPVCGSNNITYNNPGRLECAKSCGVDVVLQRPSACPYPIPATQPTSTLGTNVVSTERTTTPLNAISNTNPPTAIPTTTDNPLPTSVTISPDVLISIFGNSTTKLPQESDEIDISFQRKGNSCRDEDSVLRDMK